MKTYDVKSGTYIDVVDTGTTSVNTPFQQAFENYKFLESEVKRLQSELEQKDKEIVNLNNDIIEFKGSVEYMKGECAKLHKEANATIQKKDEELAELKERYDISVHAFSNNTLELQTLNAKIAELEKDKAHLLKIYTSMESANVDKIIKISDLQKENETLKAENEKYKAAIDGVIL